MHRISLSLATLALGCLACAERTAEEGRQAVAPGSAIEQPDASRDDATTPEASSDAEQVAPGSPETSARGASAQADAGVGPYACEVAEDCAIKNVGNCCGEYPRCVNADYDPPPFECPPGQAGVCGYPQITHCACREKRCVSMQGEKEV